jgi:hypothetical protein
MELPDRYPLANASREEVLSWAAGTEPPYERIREAVPWLKTEDQIRSYCEGLQEALADPDLTRAVGDLFGPALDEIRSRL